MSLEAGIGLLLIGMPITVIFFYYLIKWEENLSKKDDEDE